MPDLDDLIATLKQNVESAKLALNERLKQKAELNKQPETPLEESEQLDAEIMALNNMVEQSELAISSLSGQKKSGGFDEFGLSSILE